MFHCRVLFGSNGNSHTVCTQSDMCVCVYVCIYIYIYTYIHTYIHTHIYSEQYGDTGRAKENTWDSSECCVPRKFFRVPFGLACQRFVNPFLVLQFSPQDRVTTIHIHFICVPLLPQRETGEAWEPVNTEVILNNDRISSYRAVRLRYKDQSVAVA